MIGRPLRFTATARQHVRREKAWWLENRTYTEIFPAELERALQIVAFLPGAGTPYAEAGVAGLRRLYLRKIDCHLYYTVAEQEVVVRALWGARRRRPPRITP